MAKKSETKKELPKLPRGMGSYRYMGNSIQYRKRLMLDDIQYDLSVTGDTVKECNQKMKEEESNVTRRHRLQLTDDKTKLFQEEMNDWLTLYKSETVIERSYDRIESTYLTHIVGSTLGTTQSQAVNSDLIQKFLKSVKNSKTKEDLSYSSKKKIYDLLNEFFRQKYIREPYMNPMLTVTKPQKDVTKVDEELIVWDDKEMELISKEAAKPLLIGIGGYKHGLGIIFIMWTFIRLGEALALQWKDVDIENRMLTISKSYSRVKIRKGARAGKYEWKIVKTKNKQSRSFKMCQMATDAITAYKLTKNVKSEDEYVFEADSGKVLSVTSITNMYHNILAHTDGINDNKHVTIHGLRHTGITYFIRHGVPIEVISRMAGHQSIQITIDTYLSVINEQKDKAIDVLDSVAQIKFI